MAEPSTNINYSFEDIQRYLQGKMSAAEMHNIEKAALQDPFLADAIEGFNEADLLNAKQHLNEINTALLKEKKKSRVVAFNKKAQRMNIAALIVVLAGIGVVISYFIFKSSNKQTQIAQIKNEHAKNEVLQDSAKGNINTLSKKPDTTLLIAENKTAKTKSLKLKEVIKKDVTTKDTKEDKAGVASIAATPCPANQSNESSMMDTAYYNLKSSRSFTASSLLNNKDSVPGILRNKISGINIAPTIFSGKVLDEKDQPVAGAVVESTDKTITTVTNNNGDFTLWKSDTVLHAMASTVGYETKITTLKPGENNLIKLAQTNTGSNDVIATTALGISKKSKALADSAMPVGGWQNFNNYVMTKLNKDTTADAFSNPEDIVEMEFLIDNNGNPYNIKIVKPLDEQRNAKALEILKSGPKWTSTSNRKKARVSISF